MRKRICILSFSPIHRDARVLRQIDYLSPKFDLTVIGYGPAHPSWPQVDWHTIVPHSNVASRATGLTWLLLARLWSRAYDCWYWGKAWRKQVLKLALEAKADAYHANDWSVLPLAAEAARRTGARLIFDAHEYGPLQFENLRYWRPIYKPRIEYFLRRYLPAVDGFVTVSPGCADGYRRNFGYDPLVILNAPKSEPVPPKKVDPDRIDMIYHGGANESRHLELMIETMAHTEPRYHMNFMLVDGKPDYVRHLHSLAARVAPGRISFHEPVDPMHIVQRTAEYDIGFFLLMPVNYNYRVALPNKLFEFFAAGLAVVIGPSPGMAELLQQHDCGYVARSFDPRDVAELLNQLSGDDIQRMKQRSGEVSQLYTADNEMAKLVALYQRLLSNAQNN